MTAPGQIVAQYELPGEDPIFGAVWTDIREAKPRCRVRPTSGSAIVAVIKQEGSEPELHVLSGDVEIDQYEDEKYQEIRDEEIR